MVEIENRGYTNSAILVSTAWLADNLDNPQVRIVESNEDPLLYKVGHIPQAVEVDWTRDLNDPVRRDYLQREQFVELMSSLGISQDTTIVLYGDKNNWWACYSLWVFSLFGHHKVKILDGGSLKWNRENRPVSKEVPKFPTTDYQAPERDDESNRIFRDGVLQHVAKGGALIDVRSPQEYTGELLHMEGYPNEGALRGGHIPGAKNVPWASAVNVEDGTFKTAAELLEIYRQELGLKREQDIVAYCRIGERSSHTWFVLKHLLGFTSVRNYDGSWTEWGNLVNVPIER